MTREPVSSSNLASVGYDADDQLLEIQFHSGGIYQYINVPPAIHDALLAAPSKGHFFHTDIKFNYAWRREFPSLDYLNPHVPFP